MSGMVVVQSEEEVCRFSIHLATFRLPGCHLCSRFDDAFLSLKDRFKIDSEKGNSTKEPEREVHIGNQERKNKSSTSRRATN